MTTEELMEATGLSKEEVERTMESLVAQGLVKKFDYLTDKAAIRSALDEAVCDVLDKCSHPDTPRICADWMREVISGVEKFLASDS